MDERTWRVAAKMPIGDFNAVTGLAIPDEHFDTVGGWVLDLFGRVPHRGESVEADGVRVTVETMHRTRILQVLVRLPAAPTPGQPRRTHRAAGHGRPVRGRAVTLGTTLGLVLLASSPRRSSRAPRWPSWPPTGSGSATWPSRGSRVARGYMEAFQRPERLLSTAMMGVTIAHVVSSAVATAALLPWVGGQASLWATVILTPLMLVFGEILPKALTQPRATEVALRTFDPLRGGAWLLAPSWASPTSWSARSWAGWGTGSAGTRSSPGPTSASSSSASRTGRPTSSRKSGR